MAVRSEHDVQFFDSSKSMADTVSAFLLDGFRKGANLLIVATPEHRELLTRRLQDQGVDVHAAQAANRLVMADAADTLRTFMRNDHPSAAAFDEVIGTLLERLSSSGPPVRVYGEMVDLLAARGNLRGAAALEELWNLLGRRERFTLLCGYASGHFGNPRTAASLAAICAAHDHVHRKPDDLLAEFLLEQALPRQVQ